MCATTKTLAIAGEYAESSLYYNNNKQGSECRNATTSK